MVGCSSQQIRRESAFGRRGSTVRPTDDVDGLNAVDWSRRRDPDDGLTNTVERGGTALSPVGACSVRLVGRRRDGDSHDRGDPADAVVTNPGCADRLR
jgi:hypothetical protein